MHETSSFVCHFEEHGWEVANDEEKQDSKDEVYYELSHDWTELGINRQLVKMQVDWADFIRAIFRLWNIDWLHEFLEVNTRFPVCLSLFLHLDDQVRAAEFPNKE